MSNRHASRACRTCMHMYIHCVRCWCGCARARAGQRVPFGRGRGCVISAKRRHFLRAGTSYLAPADSANRVPLFKDSVWYDFRMEAPSRKNRRPKCSFLDCGRPHHANGLCHSHDAQSRNGKPLTAISFMHDRACSNESCDRMAKTKGKCAKCYSADYAAKKKAESAHPCESCADGVAYLKSRLCNDCKSRPTPTREERRAAFISSRPACALSFCERPIAAVSARNSKLASRLCARHATDASSKTMDVDSYVKLMSIDACQACGSSDRLVVDHRHDHHDHHAKMCPDCIRGRLCSDCNSALGLLRDSAERVSGLLEYVRGF